MSDCPANGFHDVAEHLSVEGLAKLHTATSLAQTLSDGDLLVELAPKLTCDEADVFAGFLMTWIDPDTARGFMRAHAENDVDDSDRHRVSDYADST